MNKRGISAVISTIVIVAVVLSVALSIAIWASGMAIHFTRFEKFEVLDSYARRDEQGNFYDIIIRFKNSGSSDTTVIAVFLNGKPLSEFWSNSLVNGTDFKSLPIKTGETKMIIISLIDELRDGTRRTALSSGQLIELDLQTSQGKTYLCAIPVP